MINQTQVVANGLPFTCLEAGSGPLVLCVHGFPDSAWSFAPLLSALAASGHRGVAPFMRGYAPTPVPPDGRYQTAVLGQDIIALITALGAEQAVVVGHDWGAAAAYAAALSAPSRISRLITAAVPYGPRFVMSLIIDPSQQRRSWYMYLLTSPIGAASLEWDDLALVDRLWADWSPGFSPEPSFMTRLKDSLRAPGAALAAASYYKHAFLPELQDPKLAAQQAMVGTAPITVPSLYLHGARDGCIGADIATDAALFTAGVRTILMQDAGHFLHVEKPPAFNDHVLEFLQA